MKTLIRHLLIMAMLNPQIAMAQQQPSSQLPNSPAQSNVEKSLSDQSLEFELPDDSASPVRIVSDRIYQRILAFINTYHMRTVTPTVPNLPEPNLLAQKLKSWEAAATNEANQDLTSRQLLEMARGTPQDIELEREARKIVQDTFAMWFMGGKDAEAFHLLLLDLFGLYISRPESRGPLEMIFAEMEAQKFTPAFRTQLEKNKMLFGHVGEGSLLAFLVGGVFYYKSNPQMRKRILDRLLRQKTAVSRWIARSMDKTFHRLANKPISRSKALAVIEHKDPLLVARFRQLYHRDPRPGEDISLYAERRNVPYNEVVRIPIEALGGNAIEASFKALMKRGGRNVFSAMNKLRQSLLAEYLELSPKQQLIVMAKFMGIGLGAGTAYSAGWAAYYNFVDHADYSVIPEDELSRFIRPLAILDLTCKAEDMTVRINEIEYSKRIDDEYFARNVNELKSLIDDYRFLLHAASMYATDPEASLPIPDAISKPDPQTGVIAFHKTYEGEEFEVTVPCPTRRDQPLKVISLVETRRALEGLRDRLLRFEVERRVNDLATLAASKNAEEREQVPAEAKDIAAKIMETTPTAHCEIVTELRIRAREDGYANLVLHELAQIMQSADPLKVHDLGARCVPIL